MSKEVHRYMSDVLSQQTQAADRIASYDELLVSCRRRWRVGMQQNADMRKIRHGGHRRGTTMIAGIYGMNFENMPELTWRWGYPAVLLLMFSACGFLA